MMNETGFTAQHGIQETIQETGLAGLEEISISEIEVRENAASDADYCCILWSF